MQTIGTSKLLKRCSYAATIRVSSFSHAGGPELLPGQDHPVQVEEQDGVMGLHASRLSMTACTFSGRAARIAALHAFIIKPCSARL
jgi:hypothetical protein